MDELVEGDDNRGVSKLTESCVESTTPPYEPVLESTTPPYEPALESTTPPYEPDEIFETPSDPESISIQPSTPIHHDSRLVCSNPKNDKLEPFLTNPLISSHQNHQHLQFLNHPPTCRTRKPRLHLPENHDTDPIENVVEIYPEAQQYLCENNFGVIRDIIEESQAFCRLSITTGGYLEFLAIGTEIQVSLAMVSLSLKLNHFFC